MKKHTVLFVLFMFLFASCATTGVAYYKGDNEVSKRKFYKGLPKTKYTWKGVPVSKRTFFKLSKQQTIEFNKAYLAKQSESTN